LMCLGHWITFTFSFRPNNWQR